MSLFVKEFKGRTLGRIVKKLNFATKEEIKHLLFVQEETGIKLGQLLIDREIITKRVLQSLLLFQHGIDEVDLEDAKYLIKMSEELIIEKGEIK